MTLHQHTVHVSGLSDEITSSDLELHFQDVGEITNVFILRDSRSKRRTGTAYVLFSETETVAAAIESKSGKKICNSEVVLKITDSLHELKLAELVESNPVSEMEELEHKMSALSKEELLKLFNTVLKSEPVMSLPVSDTEKRPTLDTATDMARAAQPTVSSVSDTSPHAAALPSPASRHEFGIKIPAFSGDGGKGELTYSQWRYEVKCLTLEGIKPAAISHVIRRSVRGTAAEVFRYLGVNPSVDDILSKFDITFGNVMSVEQLFQEFYTTTQRQGESIQVWGCRLEDLFTQLRDKGCVSTAAGKEMLRSKFWSGLRDEKIRVASRYKFDSGESYEELYKYARTIQAELSSSSNTAKKDPEKKATVVYQQSTEESMLKEILAKVTKTESNVSELTARVSDLEQKQTNVNQSVPANVVTPGNQGNLPRKPKSRRSSVVCHRCGRSGHHTKKCYAKIHVDGSPLNPKAPSGQDGS